MKSAYDVLGVGQNSTEEEIQDAYRALISEYKNDPEKIDALNEAYDQIILAKRNRSYTPPDDGFAGASSYTESAFPDVRKLIEQGRFLDADEILNGIPVSGRTNGEWDFLKGTIAYNRGMIDGAGAHFRKASEIDPDNNEFYEAMMMTDKTQNQSMYGNNYESCTSDCCTQLLCMNCLSQCICGRGFCG